MTQLAVVTAAASSVNASKSASLAFDGQSGDTSFWWSSGYAPAWLRADLGSGNAAAANWYTVTPYPGDTNPPTAWTFEGSNDASAWTTLDTRSGITYPTSTSEVRTFTFTNTTAYRYYRLNISAPTTGPGGSGIAVSEMRLGTGDPDSILWGERSGQFGLTGSFTVGVVFVPAVDGVITKFRGYRTTDTGTAVFNLWDGAGSSMATESQAMSGVSTNHWFEVPLATPVAVTAGVSYMVSCHYPNNSGFVAGTLLVDLVHGDLKIPASGTVSHNGSTVNIRYAAGNAYPTSTAGDKHLVGVHFGRSTDLALTSPTATATATADPATLAGATLALTSSTAAATASAAPAALVSGAPLDLTSPTATAEAGGTPALVDSGDVEDVVTVEFAVAVDVSVMVTLTPAAELPGTVPVLAETYLMPALTEADPVYQARVDYGVTIAEVGAVHLWVGGVDVTYFRGVPTKILRWDSEAPFGDKAAAWEMPCMEPWERPGVGDFAFMRPDAEVVIGYVDSEGTVRREWEGFYDARTRNLGDARSSVFEAKGEMWAALHHVHEPLPYMPPTDIGVVIPRLLNALPGRKFPKIPQATTGIATRTRGARDAWTWQVVQDIFAQAWTDDGRQWTLTKVGGKPRLALKKPMSEVTATVAWGTPLVDIDVTVDESSRVDVVWARGKAPGGGEWANVYYPGLDIITPPPFPNDPVRNINVGDTDAGTDTGTGVSDWQRKVNALNRWGRLAVDGSFGTTDSRVLREIQDDLGLTVDGSLGPQSWEGTFGVGVANIDLTPLRLPMVAKADARQRLYDSHGRDLGPNTAWTGTMVPREIPLDLGTNITRAQGLKACRTYLAVHGTPSVTGSVDFIGDPNEIDRTRLQVGDNLRILGVEGRDVTVQLASKSCELDGDSDGRNLVVRFTFDERARDALTIDAILERNRAALPDPARRPGNPNRSSRNVRDEGFTWDVESPCGIVERLAVNGASGLWSKRLMPVAEFGTLSRIFVEADHPFYFALFANLAITPSVVRALVGNPSTSTDPFRPHMAELENRWGLVEAWGQQGDACGYSPLTQGDPGAVFTGEFDFRTPLDYITGGDPYLAVLMFFTGGSGFADLRAYPAKDAG